MKNYIITLLLLHIVISGFSQDIRYEVFPTYKRSITKEKLIEAKTLSDINPGYPSSWIGNHISVEVLTTCNGEAKKALNTDDQLSTEQLNILKKADISTDVVVKVKYHPKHSSKNVDIQMINFAFTVVPEIEAEYPGGYQQLKQYIKENAIDKIPDTITKQLQTAKVRFTINMDGQIIHTQITETSGNEKIDQLLLKTVNKMQKWKPAENSNGIKVNQEFELNVGNMIGC